MMRIVLWIAALAWMTGGALAQNAGGGLDLTVLSFNIRYDNPGDGEDRWAKRREQAVTVIRDHAPDVVGLQEALKGQLDDLGKALEGYGRIGVGRDDGKERGEYSAILYRMDRLEVVEDGTFWLSGTPETPGSASWGNRVVRVCTWARFREKQSGAVFYLFNTHLDHQNQPSREKSAALICERIASRAGMAEPVIVTGDFNAGEKNAAVLAMVGPETGLVDSFRVAHPDETQVGTFNGFGKSVGTEKIDYVFVPKMATVRGAGIDRRSKDGRYPSDHFAVWAKVRLSS
jgi:endonuclease/exonuclease/phosphatase family metal-dependent hydrolase